MSGNPLFSSLVRWLAATELFARPSKQLPGKWRLIEFYTEPADQLINFKEKDIKKAGYIWDVTFGEKGQLYQTRNLPDGLLNETKECKWYVSQNYIFLIDADLPEVTEEFQFAIEKGILKMLKKDVDGRIRFFGFFSRIGD